jgi:hypothetical protein
MAMGEAATRAAIAAPKRKALFRLIRFSPDFDPTGHFDVILGLRIVRVNSPDRGPHDLGTAGFQADAQ